MEFIDIISRVNVAGADNGAVFTDRTRIDAALRCLEGTPYHLLRAEGIAYVLAHADYDARRGTLLISCHIDHCYRHLFSMPCPDGSYLGTFDNSVTLSVLLLAMLGGVLPAQTLVALTGDEENNGHGAEQALAYLRAQGIDPELVMCLDVTEEGYQQVHYTLENILPRSEFPAAARLRFADAEAFRQFLLRMVGEPAYTVIEAEADEAWVYDEEDVNCFTLCLPTHCPAGMHADTGIFIRQESLAPYRRAMETLCRGVCALLEG